MDAFKLAVKIFAADGAAPVPDAAVPAFHRWIQAQDVPGHLLIDVADYKHVIDGPGTVLIAHEGIFMLDRGDGRLGLTYIRKSPLDGDFPHRLRQVLRIALTACLRLADEPPQLKFRTDEMRFSINDRLLAPNTPATLAAVTNDLRTVFAQLYGGPAQLESASPDPAELFAVRIKAPDTPLAALLSRLSAS